MKKSHRSLLIHILLFVITFITTTLAGAEWMFGRSFLYGPWRLGWPEFIAGMQFSVPFLLILTVHEFGHYFTARHHRVKVTLPFYIPFWLGFLGTFSIGTMGAFIRIKERVGSLLKTFDIGLAGPLAGFVMALAVIFYGFTHLPPKDAIYQIHPEYELFGEHFENIVYEKDTFFLKKDLALINPKAATLYEADTIWIGPSYQADFRTGSNLIFAFAKRYVVPADQRDRIPNDHEMFHNPYLFGGFLALLFTALNLLPIGQLDGGHVLYGLVGYKMHKWVALSVYLVLLFYSGLGVGVLGVFNPFDFSQDISDILLGAGVYIFFLFYLLGKAPLSNSQRLIVALVMLALQLSLLTLVPGVKGYGGWLLFAIIIGRFIGVEHPRAQVEERLDSGRILLGWLALLIFILSLSPQPLIVNI